MNYLPRTPDDFSSALADIVKTAEPDEGLERLRALARTDLNYLQAIQLDRALNRVRESATLERSPTKIAVLSSATSTHLLPGINVAAFRRGFDAQLFETPFDQYRLQLLDDDSALAGFGPRICVFSLSPRELLARVGVGDDSSQSEQAIDEYLHELRSLWGLARDKYNATIVQQTFVNSADLLFGSLDRSVPGAPRQIVRTLNERLADSTDAHDVSLLDLDTAIERDGLTRWFDRPKWLQAKIEIAPAAALDYGDLVARLVASHLGLTKKCLVLDLDNTLWGGVIGDDGLEGIVLGEGSGLGEAFLAFQRYAKLLSQRGIILAVCSKNELATAQSVFTDHPEMVLSLDDIAAFEANWDDKASNLMRIAEELNIGLDALVFFDDNPAERARVRQSLPTVAVPEAPEDPSMYVDCLANAGYFETHTFTPEDQARSALYQAERQRRTLQRSTQSIDDYLKSLDMRMRVGPFTDVDMTRVSQLVNKTNQFNLTTIRRTLEELQSIAGTPGVITCQARLRDRFSDSGLVSVALLVPANGEPGCYEIDTWVMSCRVFGRQLEHAMLNYLVNAARTESATSLVADYIPTPKNTIVADLYERLGFDSIGTSGESSTTRWRLELDQYTDHNTFIDAEDG